MPSVERPASTYNTHATASWSTAIRYVAMPMATNATPIAIAMTTAQRSQI